MAQLLYEALTDVAAAADDEDVFQCGKCKKQFTSLPMFMGHKKEGCTNVAMSTLVVCPVSSGSLGQTITLTPASLGRQHIQVPTSMVLSESDLLSLTGSIDQASISPSQHSNGISLLHPLAANCNRTVTLQQDLTTLQNLSPQQTVGLQLLTNNGNPLIVTSQASPLINMPGVTMVNIASAFNKQTAEEVVSNPGKDAANVLTVTAVPVDKGETVNKEGVVQKNGVSKNGSTVNIITEFHSSMVKTRKRGTTVGAEGETTSKKHVRIMKCAFCSKTFSKNFDLQQHIRCHTGEKPFQCIVCGRAFAQKSNVKKHLQTHKVWPDGLANTLPAALPTVPSETPTKTSRKVKSNSEQSAKETSRVKVPVQSVTPILDDASSQVPVDSSYVCPYCNFNAKTYFKLKSHMKTHKQEKVYKCILNSCGQMVEDLDTFLEHIKTHENEMMYRCHLCTKTFQSLYDLGVHQYSHSLYPNQGPKNKPKYYRCNRCLNKYSTAAALDHHMATSSHSYPCPYCDKTFTCERYLRRHLQTHCSSNLHTCDQCQKGFKTEHYLKVHKLIHSGEKPFLCCQCGATFNRQDKLKRHVLIHEPIKKLKCPFRSYSGCTKEFNRPDKLKAHIITHSGNKSFVCKVCGRTFNRRTQLKAHESVHEHDKDLPFRCRKCGSGFEDRILLDEHECTEGSFTRKYRMRINHFWSGKAKKMKFVGVGLARRRGRPRKVPVMQEAVCEDSILDDDIPTSHIEIISATGDLDATNTDLTQFSLQLHPIVTHGELMDGHTVVATAEIPLISASTVAELNVVQQIELSQQDLESGS